MKPALLARRPLENIIVLEQAEAASDQPEATNAANATLQGDPSPSNRIPPEDRDRLARSYNPWMFPEGIRSQLLTPVRDAKIQPLVTCHAPLVDVVALPCEQGLLLALSNFSLANIDKLELTVSTGRAIRTITSVRHGELPFTRVGDAVRLVLPLEATDFVKVE